jgi:hypothetical protein
MAATMVAVAVMGELAAGQQAARTVPVGTQIDFMLAKELTSKDAKPDDPFEADSIVDVKRDGQVVIPSGAIAHGFIGSVRAATHANRQGQLTLSFSELQIGEQSVKLRASILAVLNPKRRPAATRDAAPIDLADPGGMSPMTGVIISPGGSLQSMMSGDLVLPVGVVLRVTLDRPIEIR